MSTFNLKPKKRRLSLEMIDFQHNDDFGHQLEALIRGVESKIIRGTQTHQTTIEANGKDTSVSKSVANSYDLNEECIAIEKLVEKRLGMRIQLVVDSVLAAIIPCYINKNHIFLNEFWRGGIKIPDQELIIREAQNKQGSVDLKKARLSGLFSEYRNTVYINFYELFKTLKISPVEVTAILLHELGHGFYAYEYADRLSTTNQTLANVALEMTKKKDKNIVYIYKELKSVNTKISEEDVDAIVNGQPQIAGVKLFKVLFETVTSQKPNDVYDQTAFESLADNFASRFGYGKELITGLDKLYNGMPEKSRATGFIIDVMCIGTAILIPFLIFSAFLIAAPLAVFYSLIMFVCLVASGDKYTDHTYDDLKTRYKRIRQEQIELLKDIKLAKEDIKAILTTIYSMDAIIADTYKYQTIFTSLSNFIFKGNRQARAAIDEEKMIEDLAFNNLFLKAAELKTL